MPYGPGDLTIFDDAIKSIQRNPLMYGGDTPRGARLAAGLARDLINHGDVPVSIENLNGWWLITCQRDWLFVDGKYRSDYWDHMISIPHVAVNSIRTEVILAALANGLFTIAEQKLQWIGKKAEIPISLDGRINQILNSQFNGRVVGFTAD
ncbi:hypothetical protein LJR220_004953 [Bradyrhizobium sp. LjRoot220]|uniref:hypothetical protein n=1 Tax=Bradyrhizobium sp. LjRoot220 TaxID=3342284 RepID=UPI003ECCAC99